MKQALNLKQTQRLTMTPQLQQAIKLLQMNTAELSEELLHAHETNLLLELELPAQSLEVSSPEESSGTVSSDETRESLNEDWESNQISSRINNVSDRSDIDYDIPAQAPQETLQQSLTSQLSLLGLSEKVKSISDYIVEYINDAGYLEITIEALHDELRNQIEVTQEDILKTLKIIQTLDPIGVGARDAEECLQLQLESKEYHPAGYNEAIDIVRHHLDLLARRDYAALRKKLRVDELRLKKAVKLIQALNPHPGYSVGNTAVNYIAPDVVVERHKEIWLARLNTSALPKVAINQAYQELITDNSANQSYSQMREQLQDAKWLLSNIEKRHNTILAVAAEIVERQQGFFDFGASKMKPLILRDIAEALDIHESTVSRATSGKYMLTPLGLFELKYFFSTDMSVNAGDDISAVAIQTMIKQLINQEPPQKPISDMKLCQALAADGYEVARRTVAKYREQMNIPPSSKRKAL